jgi:TonB family protein
MDRLQKKCFIVSAGLHLLLGLILVVGPAFLSKKQPPEMPVLDFVPYRTVDAMVSGGGNPNGSVPQPPPVAQPQPQAKPPPPAPPPRPEVREPDPPKQVPKSESLEASDEPKHKVEISKTLVTRKDPSQAEAKKRADEQAREEARQVADARRRAADAIGRTADHITSDVSSGTSLELKGPGGGGVPYANFNQAVMSVYKRAWSGTVPNDATDEMVAAEAEVTIARNGDVISARIVRSSGKPAVDRSVQAVLERVKYAAPLPEEAKENQRTVTITFEVNARKGIG